MVKIKLHWLILIALAVSVICAIAGIFIGKAIHWTKPTTTLNTTVTTVTPTPQNVQWLSKFKQNTSRIIQYLTQGPLAGVGWNWIANVTDTFGPRPFGGSNLENAIDFVSNDLLKRGFDNVHTEAVPNCPHWIRGEETAVLMKPRNYNYSMSILGFGRTLPTPYGGITANAIVVRSFAELDTFGKQGLIKGKILVYNEPWNKTYGNTVNYRYGESRAAQYGAVACLTRSITTFSVYSAHTGGTSYNLKLSPHKIPTAALTVEDAQMLWRMQQRGQPLLVNLTITSNWSSIPITSRNTVFDLTGTEKPNEIVVLSCHFDSWDVGEGAMDDAGGCGAMLMAMSALKALGLRPKRTLRTIFFTGEETGYWGYFQYFKDHNGTNETFVFLSESDMGAFRPTSLNATLLTSSNQNDFVKLKQIAQQITSNGIPISARAFGRDFGAVSAPPEVYGVPGFGFINFDKYDYYFIFHHTNGDMMTVLNPDDIDYTAALYAAIINIIANMETNFERH